MCQPDSPQRPCFEAWRDVTAHELRGREAKRLVDKTARCLHQTAVVLAGDERRALLQCCVAAWRQVAAAARHGHEKD
eukprot:3242039-Pyramimonas_sp.AAC.1